MEQLLSTKLYIPPTRLKLVSRPRLVERINEGLHRKLTLISAPAGFGKTTLVSEWVEQSRSDDQYEFSIAWLSLDENDNDLVHFLSYFIAALRRAEGIDDTFVRGMLGMLQSPQPPPAETILISLINEITALSDKIILVLDDYHLISDPVIDNALTFMLEHLPPQLHLVIATRVDPQLPLARLRAGNHLNELRAAELRFSSSEAAEFLNETMGLALLEEDISALETRTEGWIAGLQLAAISMQGSEDTTGFINSFTGSHRLVLDYLIEEVLEQQPEEILNFLLKTSVLDRMNGSLCNALTGQEGGQKTLEYLDQANLFTVPLDNERSWYRYHHLFADLLQQRLNQTQPDLLPIQYRRASEWYEQNGFPNNAIEYSLLSNDFDRATLLLNKHIDNFWRQGERKKLHNWLVRLPENLIISNPNLCIYHAWNLFVEGKHEMVNHYLIAAEKMLDTDTSSEKHSLPKMKIQGRITTMRSNMAYFQGDAQKMKLHSQKALELLPKEDFTWRSTATSILGEAHAFQGEMSKAYMFRLQALEVSKTAGNIYSIQLSYLRLIVTLRDQGRLQETIDKCQEQLHLANEQGVARTSLIGCTLAIWGQTLAEVNEIDRAIIQARKGVELVERSTDLLSIGWSYISLARILFSRQDWADLDELFLKMEKTAKIFQMPYFFPVHMSAWKARVWIAQNNLNAASQWAKDYGLNEYVTPVYSNEVGCVALARVLLAQGNFEIADDLLHRLFEAASAAGRGARAIEILLLKALSFQAQGDEVQAISRLKQALVLAEAENFIRIFVDEGPPMAKLLYKALDHGISPVYVSRLLSVFSDLEPEQATPAKTQDTKGVLIEPLTERECEVLQLISEGLTNREIASRLFLSLNTIKVHIRNVFGKLDVNSRLQAITKAKALGILPPD